MHLTLYCLDFCCMDKYIFDIFDQVFRDLIQKCDVARPGEIAAIFSNVTDITELTMTLIGSLEDTLEMTEEGNSPSVGSCFEELAEGEEFDVYDKYAQAILSPDCLLTLDGLLSRPDVGDKLAASGKGLREAVKFYLPKLLLGPVYHCFNYFKYIEVYYFFKPKFITPMLLRVCCSVGNLQS